MWLFTLSYSFFTVFKHFRIVSMVKASIELKSALFMGEKWRNLSGLQAELGDSVRSQRFSAQV